ncbi:zinc finger CCHC domain-containing protein 7 isoform X2 [Ascaphus truei]|uniref:zinc finger CCHC domain-containing protein 7 isoform X2 n=1 Tax=Ascaphus truei TaxID=8439 RepID=UPI003F5A6FBB
MFHGYEDLEAYEDDLYREQSSSDESVDSEVEFYLYSQVHYSQHLSESNVEEVEAGGDTEPRASGKKQQSNSNYIKDAEQSILVTISDSEEIKISDSSAVIIVSDTGDEDSVYCNKGRRQVTGIPLQAKGTLYNPDAHSTPNDTRVFTPRTRVSKGQRSFPASTSKCYSGGVVQEVLVIRGSSEEEDDDEFEEDTEMSESDQSDLENWMLLGSAREDGDASIQLNLEGYRSSSSEERGVEWSIGERDTEAQIGNYTPLRRSNRYYSADKNVICRNCEKRGHLSKNCPTPKKLPACCLCGERGHLQNSCPARYCSNCFLPGHFSQECIERPHWKKQCHRCSMTGHYADACPEIWRQYHLTVEPGPIKKSNSTPGQKDVVYCCNCARKGHCGYECNERRMFNGSFPTCQLIFSYDRNHDIWKREQRAKNKIEELKEAGLFPLEMRPHKGMENNILPSKKTKHKHLREYRPFHKEERQHMSKKKKFMEGHQKKKHKKKIALHTQETEEDFPRGGSDKFLKGKGRYTRKHYDNVLFKDVKKSEFTGGISKKRRNNRRKRETGTGIDGSLLIIKQRKKKSKRSVD